MIADELNKLNCPDSWKRLISTLLKNLKGVPDHAAENDPGEEILIMLRSLENNDREDMKLRLFAMQLGGLDAFRHRAVRLSDAGPQIWNPLEETYADFTSGAQNLRQYVEDEPYPPRDFIKMWFTYHADAGAAQKLPH